MRHLISKLATGSMIAGAALLVAACGDGGEANNIADNGLGNADLGNLSDPSALETLGNDTDGGLGNAAGSGGATNSQSSTGAGNTSNSAGDSGPDTGGTDAGGDTGGNTAGSTVNGM